MKYISRKDILFISNWFEYVTLKERTFKTIYKFCSLLPKSIYLHHDYTQVLTIRNRQGHKIYNLCTFRNIYMELLLFVLLCTVHYIRMIEDYYQITVHNSYILTICTQLN